MCKVLFYALFPKMNILVVRNQPKVCLDVNLWRSTGAQNNERCAICWLMTPDGLTNSVREYVRLCMYYMWTLCKDVELLHSVISFLITREAGLDTPSNKAFCMLWWFHMISMREHHHFSIRGQDLWSNSYQQLLVEGGNFFACSQGLTLSWIAQHPHWQPDNVLWSFLKIKLNSSTSEVPKWNQSEANLLL